jgi:hypothetical protein
VLMHLVLLVMSVAQISNLLLYPSSKHVRALSQLLL